MGKDCKTQLAACQAALIRRRSPSTRRRRWRDPRTRRLRAHPAMWPRAPDSVKLLLFFVFWYVGNAFYNQQHAALSAVGGKYGGLTMTVSTMQLGVCTLYAMFLAGQLQPTKVWPAAAGDASAENDVQRRPRDGTRRLSLGRRPPAGVFASAPTPSSARLSRQAVSSTAIVNFIFYGGSRRLQTSVSPLHRPWRCIRLA